MHATIFPRTSPAYWLVNIQGLDTVTATKIAHLVSNNQNAALHFPQLTHQIANAYIGLAFAQSAVNGAL